MISESPTDVQPVFDAIVHRRAPVSRRRGRGQQPEGDQVVLRAIAGDPQRAEAWRAVYLPLTRDYMHGSALDGRRVDVSDVAQAAGRYAAAPTSPTAATAP